MTDAVFEGEVSGFKTVGSRKVVCITIECPIEQISHIASVAQHGAWVAVARLKAPEPNQKAKKQWHVMLPSAQVSIRLEEPLFRTFLIENYGLPVNFGMEEMLAFVKEQLGIKSRKELNALGPENDAWQEMDNMYRAWLQV
ncbi:MAG: hypothetical protein KF802_16480 [Bdellovibrionaceae bacterium]|nr:hypothetical protein [Pseudobdellovibrionaceae bacterium]